jgi:hypothetical protein
MKITYSYQFTRHTNPVTTNYKFIVYRTHCPGIYDVIHEFDGLEALNHYKTIQDATPERLQQYLYIITKRARTKSI